MLELWILSVLSKQMKAGQLIFLQLMIWEEGNKMKLLQKNVLFKGKLTRKSVLSKKPLMPKEKLQKLSRPLKPKKKSLLIQKKKSLQNKKFL